MSFLVISFSSSYFVSAINFNICLDEAIYSIQMQHQFNKFNTTQNKGSTKALNMGTRVYMEKLYKGEKTQVKTIRMGQCHYKMEGETQKVCSSSCGAAQIDRRD